jgi:hypothetical protein
MRCKPSVVHTFLPLSVEVAASHSCFGVQLFTLLTHSAANNALENNKIVTVLRAIFNKW